MQRLVRNGGKTRERIMPHEEGWGSFRGAELESGSAILKGGSGCAFV